MTIATIPLDTYPNQTVSCMINNKRWNISLFTRLGQLYASVENSKDGVIVHNRVCLNKTPITKNLVFIDTNGDADPTYTGLNGRFLLVYSDEA
jgi:hypothetical protein